MTPPNNALPKHTPHPWHTPYNRRCLQPDCDSPVYHDGQTYWSLCLSHLQQHELGPFRPRHNHEKD